MIFSKFRACCCLEGCNIISCCWYCPACPSQLFICGCYNANSCDEVTPSCPCFNASGNPNEEGVINTACVGETGCEPGSGIPGCLPEDCNPPGIPDKIYFPVKCVKCSYFDSAAPGLYPWSNDPFQITAGTPLFEETVCRAARSGVTAGTDFGGPNFGDDGSNWWPGATGGIYSSIPCPCETVIYPFGEGATQYFLASIDYCGCTGCTSPQVFFGATAATLVNVCGVSGW